MTTKSVKAKPLAAATDRVAPNTRWAVARQCPKTGLNTVDTVGIRRTRATARTWTYWTR